MVLLNKLIITFLLEKCKNLLLKIILFSVCKFKMLPILYVQILFLNFVFKTYSH